MNHRSRVRAPQGVGGEHDLCSPATPESPDDVDRELNPCRATPLTQQADDGIFMRGFVSRSHRLFASSLGQRGLRGGGGAGRRTLPGLKRTLLAGIGTHAARQNCLRVDALKIELANKNHDFLSHFLGKNDTKT